LNFNLRSEETLKDGTRRILLEVASEDLVYLGFILESFEGWCNYTTVKKNTPYLQIDVTPDYAEPTRELINFLKNWEI